MRVLPKKFFLETCHLSVGHKLQLSTRSSQSPHFPTSVSQPTLHTSSSSSFHPLPKPSEDERLWKQGAPKYVSVQLNLDGDSAWRVNSKLCYGRPKFIAKISLDQLTVPLEFLLQFADLIALYSASRQSFHFLWFQCCFKTGSSPGIYHLEHRKRMHNTSASCPDTALVKVPVLT